MKIAVLGSGIVGRLMAWHLCPFHEIHLFTKGSIHSEDACSSVAAGMLSPYAELPLMSLECHEMGLEALRYWPMVLASLPLKVNYKTQGTLVLCLRRDKGLLTHFRDQIKVKKPSLELSFLSESDVQILEPEIKGYIGIHLPEAQLEPKQIFAAFNAYFDLYNVKWHPFQDVQHITASTLMSNQDQYQFDKIIDCRGMGAKNNLSELRGLRGEIIMCFAPHITINHTLRLLHPKLFCYLVPRENHHYAIGASVIESENDEPIHVQSALELFTSMSLLTPQFLSACVVDMQVGIRPTLRSHMPMIQEKEGVISINGMFKHGFLFAPILTAKVASHYFGV